MTTVKDLTDQDIAIIKARIQRGEKYADIASDYRLNQGRIADFKFGRIRPDIAPANLPSNATAKPTSGPKGQMSLL
jgi:hypothetical protein